MNIDVQSYNLAVHFLPDDASEKWKNDLAEHIQYNVEMWLSDMELNPKIHAPKSRDECWSACQRGYWLDPENGCVSPCVSKDECPMFAKTDGPATEEQK